MNKTTQIPPEAEMLLSLCHWPAGTLAPEEITFQPGLSPDWELFLRLAREHGIEALVWENLKSHEISGSVPTHIMEALHSSAAKSLARNTFIASVAGEAVAILKREGIEAVMLKGMALENEWYGGRGLRQMTDADILVPREKALKARKILMENGFESLPLKSAFHKPIMMHTGKHLPSLIKKGIMVEIHHTLFGGDGDALTDEFYASRRKAEESEYDLWIPDPAYLFAYLVSHLSGHEQNNESQLRLYTDLIILARHLDKEARMDEVASLAARAGIMNDITIKLSLLNEFFNAGVSTFSIPDDEAYRIGREKFIGFLSSPKNNPVTGRSSTFREQVSAIPGLHRKVLFIMGDLFPTISFMKKRYGKKTLLGAILFYPHRWGKMMWLFR